jgi:hypothetical protein
VTTGCFIGQASIVAAWPGVLDEFIDVMLENGELFLLHQRYQSAFEQLADNERHQAENEDIEQRMRRVFANPAIPLADRVRMACSIGAVLSALIGAGAEGSSAKSRPTTSPSTSARPCIPSVRSERSGAGVEPTQPGAARPHAF